MNITDYHIAIGNTTNVGKVREHNEDYMAHFATPMGYCIIICDGMGGHVAGEVASQNATVSIQQFLQDPKNEDPDIPLVLKNAIEFANYQLKEMVNQNPELRGMGTTCVLALIKMGQLYTAHVGDSRIYLVRSGSIRQITKDHSSVQKLIDAGALTEEEAEVSDKKNEILKAIGIFDKADPTITEMPLTLLENDKLLLCSDGLTAHLTKEKILETVQSFGNIQNTALKLTEQANNGGGSDNITVQLIHYLSKTVPAKRRSSTKKIAAAFSLIVAAFFFSFWIYKKNYMDNKPIKPRVIKNTDKKIPADSLIAKPAAKGSEKKNKN